MKLNEQRELARTVLDNVYQSRQIARNAGSTPDESGNIGREPELLALEHLSACDELDKLRRLSERFERMAPHLAALASIVGEERDEPNPEIPAVEFARDPSPEADAAAFEEAMGSDAPPVPPAPGQLFPEPAPEKKGRAAETEKPLDAWSLSGKDFAELPWPREKVTELLPLFCKEHAGKTAKRPRAVLAAWLRGKLGEPSA